MSESLKFIVQELNKSPYNKNLSVILFDSFGGRQLLKLLNEVFAEIDSKQNVDIDEEETEQTTARMLNLLRIFKYGPTSEQPEQIREGLAEGNKSVIHLMLEWILRRAPDLKKRAYLARFLVKLDVPTEMLADVEVNDVYEQVETKKDYVGSIEEFKNLHKQCEQLRQVGMSTIELKRDISNMEEEKKQLTKRVDRMKKKVESFPNVDVMLAVARDLRKEREREESINNQIKEQRLAIQHAEQKLQRLNQHLREMRQTRTDATPEVLIQRCEQDVQVNSYIVKEKLPKEIKARQQAIDILEKVANQPDVTKTDLDEMYSQVQSLQTEINRLVEKRMMVNEPMDDKLSMFRQQAAIIARKKDSMAETINELRSEFASVEEKVKEKREELKQLGGVEILKGDKFKQYVTKLRGKSNNYKKKRQEQSEIRAEIGVLIRTEEILKQKFEQIEQSLAALEAERGISGFRCTQDELEKISELKSNVDEEKAQTLTDMSTVVTKLNREIQAKKSSLAPVIKELRQLRQQAQEMSANYDDKKATYNSLAAGLEANTSKLEREVKSLEEECNSDESRSQLVKYQIEILNVQLEQANAELKNYLSGDASVRKQSLREQLTQHIQEQEKLGKVLKEEQKAIRDGQQSNSEQMRMWKDLQRLMECKLKNASRQNNSADGNAGRQFSANSQTLAIQ